MNVVNCFSFPHFNDITESKQSLWTRLFNHQQISTKNTLAKTWPGMSISYSLFFHGGPHCLVPSLSKVLLCLPLGSLGLSTVGHCSCLAAGIQLGKKGPLPSSEETLAQMNDTVVLLAPVTNCRTEQSTERHTRAQSKERPGNSL
jgi:hypothetical protein